jgi:hypothetical protein
MDGSMLVASTKERALLWGTIFCLTASVCLITWLVCKNRHLGRLAIAVFVLTLFIPVLVIPSVRKEYIHVSRSAITIESGQWFMPSKTVFHMTNIMNIRETDSKGIIPGNLIGDPNVSWHLTWQDGSSQIIELNEFFNAHRMVVAYYYIDRGFWLERLEDQLKPAM